jgi:hydroxyacyl-ACP dehydratase HTD2-like protein with hotdog domain
LTFNAHGIHLDQSYTRNVEGYRNLLVHGPLTLAVLLRAVGSQGLQIRDIRYRNVAPLYVDEAMRVCGKRQAGDRGVWDVWIEGKTGGLAVRGTVQANG